MAGLFDGTPLERPVTCEHCGLDRHGCSCPRATDGRILLPADQPARVSRKRLGGNRWVTVISGLDAQATDLSAMLRRLKTSLGAGGTICDGCIEIQGDHRDALVALLRREGYPAKPSGG